MTNAFWNDLVTNLEDPEFLREYVTESVRIATIDRIVGSLDAAREAADLTKAELARAIGVNPAAMRRLFSAEHVNPTLSTLSEVAAVLGMKITLQPLDEEDRAVVTEPLLKGRATDTRALVERVETMRVSVREPIAV